MFPHNFKKTLSASQAMMSKQRDKMKVERLPGLIAADPSMLCPQELPLTDHQVDRKTIALYCEPRSQR